MHQVLIEDANGDVWDAHYYCSDYCARQDPDYAGWNGCNEPPDYTVVCGHCEELVNLVDEEWTVTLLEKVER